MEEVLTKYFSGEATKDERSLVENWRGESKENAKLFLEAKSIWLASEQIAPPSEAILEKIIGEGPKESSKTIALWIKYGIAASIVIAISVGILLNGGFTNRSVESLSDGSTYALHKQSNLEVVNFDDKVREVKINGKVFFDIERDENRPFIIHTENATVKVLGTSFLVDTYESKTEVCVESGVVELLKTNDDVSVKLRKGEMGVVSNKNRGIIKKNNDNPNYLSWKTKVLTFKESNMVEVGQVLEDVYGIEVRFDNPDLKNCKLTAKFNRKKAKDAIEIISRTFNIQYDFSNNVVVLSGVGC